MCGIFGVISINIDKHPINEIKYYLKKLMLFSESRGSEASGLGIKINNKIYVYKKPVPPHKYIESAQFGNIFKIIEDNYLQNKLENKPIAIIGHSRLATNGENNTNLNNHPVIKSGIIGIHNGIIVNVDNLFNEYPSVKKEFDVDTEVFLGLTRYFIEQNIPLPESIKTVFSLIYGETSLALQFIDYDYVFLGSNTGSIYCVVDKENTLCLFASEKYFLESILQENYTKINWDQKDIFQIKPDCSYLINIFDLGLNKILLEKNEDNNVVIEKSKNLCEIIDYTDYSKIPLNTSKNNGIKNRINILKELSENSNNKIKRCTKCLLPETFPLIEFDEHGVCNFCRDYRPISYLGETELLKYIEPFRNKSGEPDCIVGFSGGRDSSYMLHYVKKILKMNPIAFSYDWGMITDLGRRNQARLCGKLGVEHIWISANIQKKRENIRKNIKAWLNKPDLGMVPLLMAGDKQFYYYAHKLMKQTDIQLIFNGANPFEKTSFKTGFCGIKEGDTFNKGLLTGISRFNKIKLPYYYGKQYLKNPLYFNSSFYDTLHSYYSTYLLPDVYLYFYNYIKWDENRILTLLENEYDWERSTDTNATWRIGDGTAAFYNYIYYTVAGFSEFDTFRSIQIRERLITREEALKLAQQENLPRLESLEWYANTIGFNLEDALNKIHSMKKLYEKN